MSERAHHRVVNPLIEQLAVIVVPTHDPPVKGQLLDLSASGAGVELPADYAGRLEESARVILVIGAHQLEKPISVPALATYRVADEGRSRCGFQFIDPAEFMAQLGPGLDPMFEQRHWLRIPPDPKAPVVTTIQEGAPDAGEEPVAAQLNDLSGLGVSLDIHVDAAVRFQEEGPVTVVLDLPETEEETRLVGSVRHRLPLGDRWRLGIEFDSEITPDFEIQHARVVEYVARCRTRLGDRSTKP